MVFSLLKVAYALKENFFGESLCSFLGSLNAPYGGF